jgi:hypothetical protein
MIRPLILTGAAAMLILGTAGGASAQARRISGLPARNAPPPPAVAPGEGMRYIGGIGVWAPPARDVHPVYRYSRGAMAPPDSRHPVHRYQRGHHFSHPPGYDPAIHGVYSLYVRRGQVAAGPQSIRLPRSWSIPTTLPRERFENQVARGQAVERAPEGPEQVAADR